MERLIVYQKDKEVAALDLERGKEYSIGRSSDNDLCLNSEDLSRQHFKIIFEQNNWCVRLTARFGEIIYNNVPQKGFELKPGDTFAVSTYLFKFVSENVAEVSPTAEIKSVSRFVDDKTDANSHDDKTFVADKTSANWSMGVPFVVITYPDRQIETLRLEGEYWIIGRDRNNEIFIDDPKASRNHAEISKAGDLFTLRDLNSSNGVTFNGRKLAKNIPTPLMSGDKFTIGNTHFYFEVRDPHFEDKIKNLPVEIGNTNIPHMHTRPMDMPSSGTTAVRMDNKFVQYKKQIAIAVVGLFVVFLMFPDHDESNKKGKKELHSQSAGKTRDNLTKEQKEFIQRSFKLAETFYMTQKYELALTEIEKIHELTPSYENSLEIEALCREAMQLKMSQKEIEMQEKQQEELQTRIRAIVNECEDRFQAGTTSPDAIRECLSQALELDPGSIDAQSLISRAEDAQRIKELHMQNQAAYNSQVQNGKGLFNKGIKLKNLGKTKQAIETFQRHISMAYPDPENLKIKSKSELETLKQELKAKVGIYKKDAQDFKSQEKIKEAILKIKKGLELDPKNAELTELYNEYFVDLRKNMKALYEDSVLEENLGNIDAAKDKWKKIKKEDLQNGEYFLKARTKLKKYGLE